MTTPQPTASWTRLRQAVHAASADWWTSPRQTDDQTNQLYNAIRAEVLAEAGDHLDRTADEVEARVADHFGPASGIGPGSADMVREAAATVRALAATARTAT